jgi:hypothetical protein
MWNFLETVRIEQSFGIWHALITLAKFGVPESFYLRFDSEPDTTSANAAGEALALRKNLDEAPVAEGDVMTREAFFSRFTNIEIARIYKAAESNDNLFAYVKKMELNPIIHKSNLDAIHGLQLLEAVGLIGAGRAAEILR